MDYPQEVFLKHALISFYGHFPDLDKSHPATVEIETPGVGKKKFDLAKYVGNQIGFQLPAEYLKEGQFIEMLVSIPIVKYYVWHNRRYPRSNVRRKTRCIFL